ncbi:unnamed protein product [Paramecium primaurelia]|uniref:Hikeshi-like N-terminal domain-containing protein n=1 Tax=Paramecium primaurelia TaxID=5886 RepID=A0A8S1NZR3_PARPR|nr:unnamed protein product [Paramecium primaurelia]
MFSQPIITPFALMIPGQLAITQFTQINNSFVVDVNNPAIITSIAFFLMQPLDEGIAACLYYSYPPYSQLEFLGAIANARPSDIFSTSFSLNPHTNKQAQIKIVIQLQQIDQNLQQMILMLPEKQGYYFMAIAQHLDRFLQDYPKQIYYNEKNQQMLVVPTISLNKWLQRFTEKYNIDPNFLFS